MPACIACSSRDVESTCSGAYMAETSDVIYLGSSPVVECPACGTKPLRCQPELYGDVFRLALDRAVRLAAAASSEPTRSVSMRPGSTMLTVTPSLATSAAAA